MARHAVAGEYNLLETAQERFSSGGGIDLLRQSGTCMNSDRTYHSVFPGPKLDLLLRP